MPGLLPRPGNNLVSFLLIFPFLLVGLQWFHYLCVVTIMDREQFKGKKQWAGEAIPSMKRRRVGHDYHGRCIYMVTLVVKGRRPLFGCVTGDGEREPAIMHPSPLGKAVLDELGAITLHYPAVAVISQQLMPDHLHVIIFVKERIDRHLSQVINGYKGGCSRVYRQLKQQRLLDVLDDILWEDGYNDRILEGKNHLQRMMDYLDDNPRRLAIKRNHPEYFQVQRNIQVADLTFAALGNLFLLRAPQLLQVQCTRKLTLQEIDDTRRYFLSCAANGAVLVSPSISPGEKAVMRAAFENGYPIIILQENGFAPLAKPGGKRFDACTRGRLLLLAPWEHHNDRRTIKQQQCWQLNDMAAAICNQSQE